MSLVYYDASTDTVYTMNAEWNTVLAETNPMSIPGGVDLSDPERGMLGRDPSGKTALVGGFMKGVGALGRGRLARIRRAAKRRRCTGLPALGSTYSRLWTLSRIASSTCRSMRGAA